MARNRDFRDFRDFLLSSYFSPAFLFLLIILPTGIIGDSTQGSPTSKYEVPALGRSAQLGEFYDEVSQSFLGLPIFKEKLPLDLITTNEIPWTSSQYTMADTLEEKSQLIKLSLELTISIFFGLVKIRGSAEYMNEQKTFTHSVAVFMDYQVRTIKESIQPLYDDIQGLIAQEYLQNIKATHIVIGIDYGGDVVVKFEDKNEERESNEHASGSLGVAVQALMGLFSASGSAATSVTPKYKKKGANLSIKVFGDVSYGSDHPMNFDQLREFIKKVPALVQKANNGKGKPMSYVLFPLDVLRKKLQMNVPPTLVTQLDSALLQELVQITDRIAFVQQKVNDLVAEFTNNDMCLTKVHMKELLNLQDKFESHTMKFKVQVKKLTLEIRGGQVSPEQLVKVKEDFLSSSLSPDKVTDSLNTQFTPAQEKIRLCRTLIEATPNRGPVDYFSNAASLISFHYKHTGKNVFVLYYSVDFIKENKTAWLEQSTRFFQIAQSPINKMAIMDCEFPNADCLTQNIRQVTLSHFKNGRKMEASKEGPTASAMYKFPRNAQILEIPALGTTEKLGALFSEKTRKFIGVSVLNVDTPFMESEPASAVDHTILFPRQSLLDKLRALNIPMELRLSILTGAGNSLPSIGNIRRYFRDGQASYGGLVSRLRTMKESVNISSTAFQNNMNLDRALRSGSTHYIHSIFYGGTSIFQTPGQISNSPGEIQRDLQTIRTMFSNVAIPEKDENGTTITTTTTTSANKGDEEKIKSKMTIIFMSDIPTVAEKKLGPGGDLTKDVKETIQNFFQSLAGAGGGTEGKGVPVAYLLHPLHSLEDEVDTLETPEDRSKPAATYELDFLQHFEDLQSAEDSLLEFQSNFTSPERKMCVSPSINVEISAFIKEFTHNKTLWIERVKSALELANPEPSIFKQLSYEAEEKFTALNVIREAKLLLQLKHKGALRKMRMCEWAESVGVLYLGLSEDSSLDEAFWNKETNKDVYLLFFKEDWTQGPLWIKALNIFFSFLNLPNHRLFLVDCDNSPRLKTSCDKLKNQQPTILEYRNGTLTNEIPVEIITAKEERPTAGNATLVDEENKENITSTVEDSFKNMDKEILCVEKKLEGVTSWLRTEFASTLLKTQELAEDYCGVTSTDTSNLWKPISKDQEDDKYCTKIDNVQTRTINPLKINARKIEKIVLEEILK